MAVWLWLTAACSLLSGCTGGSGSGTGQATDFTLGATQRPALAEGNPAGVNIAINLSRKNAHNKPVVLNFTGITPTDSADITASFFPQQIDPQNNQSSVNIRLDIGDLPLLPQARDFVLTATDGTQTASVQIRLDVQPVAAPDVYLLIGQSNMVGFSGDGTKTDDLDATNPRILQLNVSKNDQFTIFAGEDDFSSRAANVVNDAFVIAEDPLHIPLDPSNTTGKDLSYIGMGLSFAKAALPNTTQDIILVPAAWSGSAFCNNDGGPNGQWMPVAHNNPELGNSWLFQRAVTRANIALNESGGILRGILWHQGESDSNSRCADTYLGNLESLVKELRLNISPDQRGGDLRRPEANIPFVLGTMSRGIDDRGDLSVFSPPKQTVDDAHKILPGVVPHVALSDNINLVPAFGYDCGNTTCIHFGPRALREMGRQYYNALVNAADQP